MNRYHKQQRQMIWECFFQELEKQIEISKERKPNSNKVKFFRMSNCNSRENDKRKKNKFMDDNDGDEKG